MPKIVDPYRPRALWSSEDEGALSELRVSLRNQFPNPQRIGCPGDTLLSSLAQGRLELNEAEAWLDHFSRCSACFCDFEKMQSQAGKWRRLFAGMSVAGAIALVVVSALLLTNTHHNMVNSRSPTLAQIQPTQRMEISLHYEDVISSRGTAPEPETRLQKLPRRPLSLSIYLPPGSETGGYDLAFLATLDGPHLVECAGTVTIENGIPVLRVTPDISSLPAGAYILALRPGSGHWRYFRLSAS